MRYEITHVRTHRAGRIIDPYWEEHDGYPLGRDEGPCQYAWIKVPTTRMSNSYYMFVCSIHGCLCDYVDPWMAVDPNRDAFIRNHERELEELPGNWLTASGAPMFIPWRKS